MASKIKVDTLETADGSGSIALSNQFSGMTVASLPPEATAAASLTGALPALDGSNLTGVSGDGNTPAFSVRPSSDQNVDTANTWYKVEWDTEDFDTDNAFDNTNDKFTVPTGKGGVYQVNVQVATTGQTENAETDMKIYKNGSALDTPIANREFSGGGGSNADNTVQHSHLYDLNATDYLEIYVFHGSGGTNTIRASRTSWSMFKLAGTS
jgi:hypothetical protein